MSGHVPETESVDVATGAELARTGGRGATRVVAPVITMDAVHRYVENERGRSRRALLASLAVFLFVLLLVLAVFIAVGIHVLRSSRRSEVAASEMKEVAERQTLVVAGVSNSLYYLENRHLELEGAVADGEAARHRESVRIRSDLDAVRKLLEDRSAERAAEWEQVQERILGIESANESREKELAEIREESQALLLAAAAGAEEEEPDAGIPSPVSSDVPDAGLLSVSDAAVAGGDAPFEFRRSAPLPAGTEREIHAVAFPNGDRYEGEFRDGLLHGRGVYSTSGGDRYEGEFRYDQREGRGSLKFSNGDRYVGEFRNDTITGRGTMLYSNGDKYVGEFTSGVRDGQGTMTFANGDVYKGDFKKDTRSGQGTYLFSDGSKYVGAFVAGKRHGTGHYFFADGSEFIGEFRDGRKWGLGVSVYPNGRRVKGYWRDDQFERAILE